MVSPPSAVAISLFFLIIAFTLAITYFTVDAALKPLRDLGSGLARLRDVACRKRALPAPAKQGFGKPGRVKIGGFLHRYSLAILLHYGPFSG